MDRDRLAHLIALTGYGAPEDRVRSEEAGFDLHLVKPVELVEIGRVLAQLGPVKRARTDGRPHARRAREARPRAPLRVGA